MVLSQKQRALLLALREIEEANEPVDIAALALQTAYSEASIRTYFNKKLEGVLVFRDDKGWKVDGALRCAERVFARHMTQKSGSAADTVKTEEAWQLAVRKILYEGMKRSYTLGPEERAIIDRLEGRDPPPRSRTRQPGLFKN
jgi:transcriptional antiterminator